ncbi:uncharacterized protein PV07_01904 [Cladophialophora immunda]|uniref:3'-5' exonuclease domain-containing protein n=1 Tax=Cladophialophora immunda TaxID=569365 RepID=A0A0D2A4E7_9EURO|nr:uncharacterized protein PV07_01904 [Cladophialophora immunda]KIW35191.1 hypothetical protein PV07_01904 [Cladophialophora immunda]OQV04660.1 hypothetical protein CLAIMM_09513 [Cladophialophora immunda]
MAPFIVDNEVKLHALLTLITKRTRAEQDQLMFIDLEGVDLGRSGTIAIMQLLMPPSPIVYLVDVHQLEAKAFDLTTADGTSLRAVLESPNTFKVFFDIRNDSDALHAHFGVNVAGIIDLQVIEFATRNRRGRYVNGLAKCIEKDLPHIPGWSLAKAKGRRLFAPEAGGKYGVFLERPLPDEILQYCEQDVMLMPRLLAVYGGKLQAGVAAQLQGIVDERIRLSKTDTFIGNGRHMAVGPHLGPARYLKVSTSRELQLVRSARLVHLCRLDDSCIDDLTSQLDAVHINAREATASAPEASSLTPVTSPIVQDAASSSRSPGITVSNKPVADEGENDDQDDDEYAAMGHNSDSDPGHNSDSDRDYTACSAEDCGYCGRCGY